MARFEHTIAANKTNGEVKCTLCGDFDVVMDVVSNAEIIKYGKITSMQRK